MRTHVYYDHRRKRYLTERDGCSLEDWKKDPSEYSYARDPRGFNVFLAYSGLRHTDEYSDGDPYSVEVNMANPFHARRFAVTEELVASAVDHISIPRILDIGCGEGYVSALIKTKWPSAEVFGLDHSISAIGRAVAKHSGPEFIVADAYSLPYCDGYFDVVVCNNLWEHVPDPLRLLNGIQKVLRPGGHVVISTPSRYRLSNMLRVVTGRSVLLMSPLHVTEYSVGQVMEQLRYGAFDVVKIVSRPLKYPFNFRQAVHGALGALLQAHLSLVNSHHNLESTVFFLGRKGELC